MRERKREEWGGRQLLDVSNRLQVLPVVTNRCYESEAAAVAATKKRERERKRNTRVL